MAEGPLTNWKNKPRVMPRIAPIPEQKAPPKQKKPKQEKQEKKPKKPPRLLRILDYVTIDGARWYPTIEFRWKQVDACDHQGSPVIVAGAFAYTLVQLFRHESIRITPDKQQDPVPPECEKWIPVAFLPSP